MTTPPFRATDPTKQERDDKARQVIADLSAYIADKINGNRDWARTDPGKMAELWMPSMQGDFGYCHALSITRLLPRKTLYIAYRFDDGRFFGAVRESTVTGVRAVDSQAVNELENLDIQFNNHKGEWLSPTGKPLNEIFDDLMAQQLNTPEWI